MQTPYEVVILGDVESPEDALRGLVQSVCTSVADTMNTILTIIHEKYGHSKEELAQLLHDDPRLAESLKVKLSPKQAIHVEQTLKTKKGKKVIIKKPQ